MLVSLTVGKVDAGVAVLLTSDKRLIEFPFHLATPSITSGSIVDITVSQNFEAEQKAQAAFESLQTQILNTYGLQTPATPELRLRNATQSTIVLEWDPIQLATTKLRSLSLYRNGQKAGNIPRPMDMLSTKISGLQMDTEYSFYMVLRTSGGTYTSNTLTVKTHDMNNLTGIRVTPGVLPPQLRESLEVAVERIGAKIVDTPRIDTTHFVCTEGRGKEWERANEMNIPVVRPEWIEGCEREGKIIGVRGYYLDAKPKDRQIGSNPSLSGPLPSVTTATATANAPMASPTSQQALAATQAELPTKTEPRPQSPDRESTLSDGGEPGPEINEPPTPPPKDRQDSVGGSHQPTTEAEADANDDDDENADETQIESGNGVEPTSQIPEERILATTSREVEDSESEGENEDEDEDEKEEEESKAKSKGKAKVDDQDDGADEEDKIKNGDMEDVAL